MMLYCIGLKAPIFPIALPYTHVSPTLYSGINQLIIPDDIYGANFHGSVLSEYIQLFWLAELLKNNSHSEKLYFFQYRKFISFKPGLQLSANQPYAYACTPSEGASLFPSVAEFANLGGSLLLGPSIKIRSTAHHYGIWHLIEDFSKFTLSLNTISGFNAKRCKEFIDCQFLIPAPSLGVTRVDLFIEHMSILREVWEHFSTNFLIPREGYQRRVGGFLLERLHSFLLYEQFNPNIHFEAIQGHQVVISNTTTIIPTI